jgi:hypothetical protein
MRFYYGKYRLPPQHTINIDSDVWPPDGNQLLIRVNVLVGLKEVCQDRYRQTPLEEINGDLLEADFWPGMSSD